MRRVRRTRYLFLRVLDDGTVVALSVLCGVEVPLDDEQLGLLRGVPADRWQDLAAAGSAEALRSLAQAGLVVTDSADPELAELRRRDEQLAAPAWNRYAALFHAFTRWSDVHAVVSGTQPIPTTPDRWPPPPHFHAVRDDEVRVDLPTDEAVGPLYDLLTSRRTTRAFDQSRTVRLDQLSTVLRYVWGAHGTRPVRDPLVVLRKTSPSGGSQHPGEVYPLVRDVEGVDPGLYHYSVEHHALEPLELMAEERVRGLVCEFSAGQDFFAGAHVVFLMTARYARTFWKYRAHAKAYRTVMLDAAFLSQTLYLVCGELGLGAFVTGAINEQDIDAYLSLPAFTEGTVLMTGCGIPAASARQTAFAPYRPPRP
jgi:putative peptide maturation dehydrogenase